MAKKKEKKWGGLFFLLLLFGLVLLVRYSLKDDLVVREYNIITDQITEPHTFAVITDLHCTEYGPDNADLRGKVHAAVPDAVFFVGDISDGKRDITVCEPLFNDLAAAYPCYFVAGNHDQKFAGMTVEPSVYFASLGATVLDAAYEDVTFGGDTIRIHGIADPIFYIDDDFFDPVLETMPVSEAYYDILLSHRAEKVELYTSIGFDLTLCGHAHGGQIRIPYLLDGLYAPGQGLFPEYAGGRYTENGCDVIISHGLMIDDKPRVFNPPELVIVNLIPEGE